MGQMSGEKPSPHTRTRFHGRVVGDRLCAVPGCPEPGEFRAPAGRRPGFDGPGDWKFLCLDHIRAFNAGYNFFDGMSADEIARAQGPYGGWERETRAFAATGADLPPAWENFRDPMDALGARFAKRRQQADDRAQNISPEDRKAYTILGLEPNADRRALRQAYSRLVRQYHPDRNGGDRRHEDRLSEVVEAYQHLRRRILT